MREKLIDADLGSRLEKMMKFCNLAVHRYHDLDLDIVEAVIRKNLDDLLGFAQAIHPQFS